jgi:hypothetical protein
VTGTNRSERQAGRSSRIVGVPLVIVRSVAPG